jgi:hypothetical protein
MEGSNDLGMRAKAPGCFGAKNPQIFGRLAFASLTKGWVIGEVAGLLAFVPDDCHFVTSAYAKC